MKILNYGSMNIDNVYNVDHNVASGETQSAFAKNIFCGGKGLNQSVAVAKAGGHVEHAGIVGEDGSFLVSALESAGVGTEHIIHADGPSGHTVIQVDKAGQNSIIVFSGENMRPTEAQIAAILEDFGPGDIVLMQNELYNSRVMMKLAAEKGMTVIFNPSPVNEGIFSYPLDKVSWFVVNEIEGSVLSKQPASDPEGILNAFRDLYPGANVVLTLGENGAYCMRNGEVLYQPAFKVTPTDTTAAGDTFLGYFIAGLAAGMEMPVILRRAACASSVTVTRMGAGDSIPYAEEIDRLLAE